MVTPDAPVKTVKNAQTISVTIAKPPGNQPTKFLTKRINLCEKVPLASMYPAKVNSGILANKGIETN